MGASIFIRLSSIDIQASASKYIQGQDIEELSSCIMAESADEKGYCIEDHVVVCMCPESPLRELSNRVFRILY